MCATSALQMWHKMWHNFINFWFHVLDLEFFSKIYELLVMECLNNVPENGVHLNYVPKVPQMGYKLGTKSSTPQSSP